MSGFPLQNQSGIIIDDQPEMCRQLYMMLERLGLKRIVTCDTGEAAVDLLAKSNFDIILCDYDLGPGKDGLQVLEECRHRSILPYTSCFVMITAVQTGEMVLGAIEYQPDAYILKPITFDDLRLRLAQTKTIKDTYFDILHNLDQRNYSAALAACDQIAHSRPKLVLTVLKFKSTVYLEQEKYEEAVAIYKEVLKVRKLPWALFGMAKSYFLLGRYHDATSLLQGLIEQNNNYTTAYDLLAEIKDRQGDKKGAQKVLERALAFSPRAIRRQTYLSRLAVENQDWKVALQASRKGVELGRHSVFKSPDNYINLSAALQPQLASESLSDRRSASNEILKVMDTLKKDFKDDTKTIISAHFIEGSTYKQMGQEKEGSKYINLATNLMETNQLEMTQEHLDIISQRISLACDSDTLKSFVESDICKNLSKHAKEYIENKTKAEAKREEQEKLDHYNNKGVEFFDKGMLAEAIQMFAKATEYEIVSHSVMLNALQAHIAYLEKFGKDGCSLAQCESLLERLNQMPPTDRRQARKRRLESMLTKLKEDWRK